MQRRIGLRTLARRNLEQVLTLDDQAGNGVRRADAQLELARLDIADLDIEAARERLAELKSLATGAVGVALLEGEILQAEGRFEEATRLYDSVAQSGNREGVIRLAGLQMASGELDTALASLDAWLAEHPEDLGARILLADGLMRQADAARAIAHYEALVESGNPVVLNNLAWLYMERGDQRAVAMAEKAMGIAPDNADIADTLGWILVQFGQPERGISYIRQSSEKKPGDATVRYHLGVAYLEAGRTQAGRTALEEAISLGEFPEIEEARKRLSTLGAS